MAQILTSGTPGATRTPDLRIRSPTLYPTELRAHPSFSCGVSEGDRTLGHRSHNPALYHLSYTHHIFSGTPERIRTSDLRIRSPLLYPTELQAPTSPRLVGARGFEPPTPCSQGRCAYQAALRPVAEAYSRGSMAWQALFPRGRVDLSSRYQGCSGRAGKPGAKRKKTRGPHGERRCLTGRHPPPAPPGSPAQPPPWRAPSPRTRPRG